jgi:hypothetical protein
MKPSFAVRDDEFVDGSMQLHCDAVRGRREVIFIVGMGYDKKYSAWCFETCVTRRTTETQCCGYKNNKTQENALMGSLQIDLPKIVTIILLNFVRQWDSNKLLRLLEHSRQQKRYLIAIKPECTPSSSL